jgi:hypothetical protein
MWFRRFSTKEIGGHIFYSRIFGRIIPKAHHRIKAPVSLEKLKIDNKRVYEEHIPYLYLLTSTLPLLYEEIARYSFVKKW